MSISRRTLLRRLGAGAAIAAAVPGSTSAFGAVIEPAPEASTTRRGGPVRLDRNESAFGASPKAVAAMQRAAQDEANRYPDEHVEALRRTIAERHNVALEQVVLGCGSGEILRMAADAFLGRGGKLVVAQPTYPVVADYARRAGGTVVAVKLSADYSHDLTAMLARSDGAGLVYICNPNNPTGSLTGRRAIDAFLRQLPGSVTVLVDEAYHHYVGASSDYASFIDRPASDGRVIVTRTFSKIFGLAGVRVGYAIAPARVARALEEHRLGDGVNAVAAAGAAAALDDTEHLRAAVTRNTDHRQEFLNHANARMVKGIDSHANFVMLNAERPAADVVAHFRKQGVLLPPPFPPFETRIRVSLGTPADMQAFWKAWDLLPPGKMSM